MAFDTDEAIKQAEAKHQLAVEKNEQKARELAARQVLENKARADRHELFRTVVAPEVRLMEAFLKERNYKTVTLTFTGEEPAPYPSCVLSWRSITDYAPELAVKFEGSHQGFRIGGNLTVAMDDADQIKQKLWDEFHSKLGH